MKLDRLAKRGFATFPREEIGRGRYHISELFEILRPSKLLVTHLHPKTESLARPNTLSAMFGLNEFPAHTDRCLDDVPPHFLLLIAPRPRAACTLIFDTAGMPYAIKELARQSLFENKGKRRTFTCRFMANSRQGQIVRYNPLTMNPVNTQASELASFISDWPSTIKIDWSTERAALVDNWRCLHSRENVHPADNCIWRISMWNNL